VASNSEPEPARQRDLVVVGASAGGVEALSTLVATLPQELPASMLVVLHVLSSGTSVLPSILDRAGALPASAARHGQGIERGHIYVAPPDHHMLVAGDHLGLTRGPRENGHRPAIDPLFRSAARNYGDRVIAVVLSGMLDDGTAGLRVVQRSGGTTLVQDPDDAVYDGMPRSAIDHGAADHIVEIDAMAAAICELIDTPLDTATAPEPVTQLEPVELDLADKVPLEGSPSGLTCPECGGALWEQQEGDVVQFRCHVGHAYSVESMQAEQAVALEAALWSALRSLRERADLFRRLARRAVHSGQTASRFTRKAEEVDRHAEAVRQTIAELGRAPAPPTAGEAEPAA
jgi:two-component system, chemotaxis family, protein-glutamate methylesterase/glutaminase